MSARPPYTAYPAAGSETRTAATTEEIALLETTIPEEPVDPPLTATSESATVSIVTPEDDPPEEPA